jgi:hypothetical protein
VAAKGMDEALIECLLSRRDETLREVLTVTVGRIHWHLAAL